MTGVDLDAGTIADPLRRRARRGRGRAGELDYADRSFDIVLYRLVLHLAFQGPLQPVLDEAARLLEASAGCSWPSSRAPGSIPWAPAWRWPTDRPGHGVHGTPDDIPPSADAHASHLGHRARARALRVDLRLAVAPAGGPPARPASARRPGLAPARRTLRPHAFPDRPCLGQLRRRALGAGRRGIRRSPAAIADFVRGLERAERALDLGAGDGRLTELIDAHGCSRAPTCRLWGWSAPSAACRRRSTWSSSRRMLLPFADSGLRSRPPPETIEHVRDVQLLLSEIRRVPRPGARLALTTPASVAFCPPTRSVASPPAPVHQALARVTSLSELGFEVVLAAAPGQDAAGAGGAVGGAAAQRLRLLGPLGLALRFAPAQRPAARAGVHGHRGRAGGCAASGDRDRARPEGRRGWRPPSRRPELEGRQAAPGLGLLGSGHRLAEALPGGGLTAGGRVDRAADQQRVGRAG